MTTVTQAEVAKADITDVYDLCLQTEGREAGLGAAGRCSRPRTSGFYPRRVREVPRGDGPPVGQTRLLSPPTTTASTKSWTVSSPVCSRRWWSRVPTPGLPGHAAVSVSPDKTWTCPPVNWAISQPSSSGRRQSLGMCHIDVARSYREGKLRVEIFRQVANLPSLFLLAVFWLRSSCLAVSVNRLAYKSPTSSSRDHLARNYSRCPEPATLKHI